MFEYWHLTEAEHSFMKGFRKFLQMIFSENYECLEDLPCDKVALFFSALNRCLILGFGAVHKLHTSKGEGGLPNVYVTI